MRHFFYIIFGIFIVILITTHFVVFALFFCPAPKALTLLNLPVSYVRASKVPEHIYQIFQRDTYPEFSINDTSIVKKLVSKTLKLKQQKLFDKDEQFELYINTLDFGGDVVGMEAASLYYFKKPVEKLSLKEGISLLGFYRIFGE